MLVLAPAACCLGGVAAHEFLLALTRAVHTPDSAPAAAIPGSVPLADPTAASPAIKSRVKGKGSAVKVWSIRFSAHRMFRSDRRQILCGRVS